jgi:hypothetical protein
MCARTDLGGGRSAMIVPTATSPTMGREPTLPNRPLPGQVPFVRLLLTGGVTHRGRAQRFPPVHPAAKNSLKGMGNFVAEAPLLYLPVSPY